MPESHEKTAAIDVLLLQVHQFPFTSSMALKICIFFRLDCTHFTWTDGTCWMKQYSVTESDAFISHDKESVCGIVENDSHINWNANDWAFGCAFWENDLSDIRVSGEDCSSRCVSTKGINLSET